MSLPLLFALIAVALLAGALVFLFVRQAGGQRQREDSQMLASNLQQRIDQLQSHLRVNLDGNTQLIQQQMGLLTQQLDERLNQGIKSSADTTKQVNDRLDNAARVIGELQNRLGKLNEANEKIYNVGKDISSLQEILRNPKSRGAVGELLLGNLLAEMLPREHFELQYGFKSNEKVDAVVKVGDRLVPIDSKFPLENFKRLVGTQDEAEKKSLKKMFLSDVKKHIDAISKKYILPAEGTFDFGFMYIPAENVFYEVVIRDSEDETESLQAYALRKRVIPVSPNSFYAYLGALMHALRGERMQKNIVEITAQIRHLSVELGRFKDDFEKIGFHLNNLKNSYESAEKRFGRYQDRLERINEAELADSNERPVKLITN